MVRTYRRKTDRANVPHEHLLKAVRKVLFEKCNLSHVASEMSIPRRSLTRYCKKASQLSHFDDNTLFTSIGGYRNHKKVLI